MERIKKSRETGEKVEYEFEEEERVYDLVDEDKYAQIVQERQEEDFIVDDDGTGYTDDGREIFDDDPNEVPLEDAVKVKKNKKENNKAAKANTKITSMFIGTKKRKEKNVTLDGDDVLENILSSIENDSSAAKRTGASKTPKRAAKHPPRRLQEESLKKKKLTLKKTTHITPNRFKIKKEEEAHYDHNENNVQDDHGMTEDIESFKDSQDSCYGSQEAVPLSKKIKEEKNIEEFDSQLDDDADMMDLDESELQLSAVKTEVTRVKQEEKDSHLEDIFNTKEDEEVMPSIDFSGSTLPLIEVNGEKVLRFFWLDAYEDRYHQPGTVFLFGKVFIESSKTYVSCCVTVKHIERNLFILPRKTRHDQNGRDLETPVIFKDVYDEFNERIAIKYKLKEFKCKPSTKKYSFDLADVPHESDYLQFVYSAEQEQLPSDLKGETFSHVFGTNTSSLELLFLKQNIQGPSWIDIQYPQPPKHQMSWCKIEAVVDKPSFVKVVEESLPLPPLTVLSLSMLTANHPKTHSHEIISISGLIHNEIYLDKGAPTQCFKQNFCFVTKTADQLLPYDFQSTLKKKNSNIQVSPNERAMLGLLLAKIQQIDPDVLVGHDIHGFDLDILLNRFTHTKVPFWSKIGRLKRSQVPKSSGKFGVSIDKSPACGRLVCDVKISAKELIRCKSYDLTELVSVILSKERTEVQPDEVPIQLRKTGTLLQMLDKCRHDSVYSLQIMYELNVLPLAFQITGICGNVMSRTLLGGRSERNEFLLLHAFSKKQYILPDKSYRQKHMAQPHHDDHNDELASTQGSSHSSQKKNKGRKKPAYAGGLVLEPKKGFYDKYILLLDFNSLYPSIIQEYNICFTTIAREMKKSDENDIDELPDVPSPDMEFGILPTEIKRLVERRREVKKLLKTVSPGSELYLQYDIRQKALKLTANSMYGCLGFSHSRFYAKPLAALVTGKGREILMKTKDLASSLGLDVIYGDTDSIMINTNSSDLQEVRKIGTKVKTEVNKLYKMIEIDIDGIFKSMLLLKKKKYAAVMVDVKPDGTIVERKEMKGLDIVRRDWSGLAKDAGNYVLEEILSSKSRDVIVENIHDYLRNLKEQINENQVDLSKYEIHKSLTKHPEEYPDKKSLPHVTVASRMMSQGRRVAVGDTISYVICDDSSQLPASQRAYSLDELSKNTALKIDKHYYLSSQIHPVVSRLCDPIDGTDATFIAENLGLDPTAYKSHDRQGANDTAVSSLMNDEDRFKDVERFIIKCRNPECSNPVCEFKGAADDKFNPFVCGTCNQAYNINQICNSLKIFLRGKIKKYYNCWLQCDDETCGFVSRHISVQNYKSSHICQRCHRGHLRIEYNDSALHNQMLYLSNIFDVSKSPTDDTKRARLSDQNQGPTWKILHNEIDKVLRNNAYSMVNLANLF